MITSWCGVTVRWEHWIQLIKLTKFASKTELWHNGQLACLRSGSLPLFCFQTSVHFKLHEISFPVCLEMPMGKYLGWAEVQEKDTCWSGKENSSTDLLKLHWLFQQIIYLDEGGLKKKLWKRHVGPVNESRYVRKWTIKIFMEWVTITQQVYTI